MIVAIEIVARTSSQGHCCYDSRRGVAIMATFILVA